MKSKRWDPYIAGALTGLLLILSVLIAGKFFGASTTFSRSMAVIEKRIGVDVNQFEYFTTKKGKYGPNSLPNWQLMFVLGIIIGGFIASTWSGTFKFMTVPDMWRQRFGGNPAKRAIIAFIGGAIALFGVRLAGGCPSGHGISGISQLAVSGFIALGCFFIGGLITAKMLYRN